MHIYSQNPIYIRILASIYYCLKISKEAQLVYLNFQNM